MAYDGIVISGVINDIKTTSLGGRVVKIQQPGVDTVTLTVKGFKGQTKIYISVNNSLPIVYIADELPQAPMQAPAFCMLLRKHISNGKLVDIKQPGFDRIFDFVFEHLDEMGDIGERHLIVEIMGRQSNIILTDSSYKILDCIRRVMPDLTDEKKAESVRIIYPGSQYETPDSQGKIDPIKGFSEKNILVKNILEKNMPLPKALYTSITGVSKASAEYLVSLASVDARKSFAELSGEEKDKLSDIIFSMFDKIGKGEFSPGFIYSSDGTIKDYMAITDFSKETDADKKILMSMLLIEFYGNKEKQISIRSKTADLRKQLQTAIERTTRKYDLQLGQLKDTEDRDKYRIYGELLNTYGYELKGGETSLKCINYYDNTEIEIPLDPELSAQENSQKYFAKYNKKKRTFEALECFVEQSRQELEYLLSVKHNLEMAETDEDIKWIQAELGRSGLLRIKDKKSKDSRNKNGRKNNSNKQGGKSPGKLSGGRPLHFVSSAGYDIYVGKNNIQNEEITFELATGRDLWFHAKQMPGSHVIVKIKKDDKRLEDIPDSVFEEAAQLAAYYSSGNDRSAAGSKMEVIGDGKQKIEIDYTERKNLKKPPQAKPGYVIYHTNYSMMAIPSNSLQQIE